MSRLQINLFGGLTVVLDGQPITQFYSNKVRALLAYLLLEADQAHSRDKLAGLLWAESPESRARRNLSQALNQLRQTIGDAAASPPHLLISRQTIQWNSDSDYRLDTLDFVEQRIPQNYRGELLEGFFLDDCQAFQDWLTIQRENWRTQALTLYAQQTSELEHSKQFEALRTLAQAWLALDSWQEEAHRVLMRAHVALGDPGAALAQYEQCRDVLFEELGIEPTEETQALYHQIRLDSSSFEVTLPQPTTPFVGRSAEIKTILSQLAKPHTRLLTILGTGGIGKTRVALEVARQHSETACFVPLAGVTRSSNLELPIANAILEVLGQNGVTSAETLFDFLADRPLLLVLDNFEHLLTGNGSRRFVARLIQQCPNIRCLVTSRVRLKLQAEQVVQLEGLVQEEAANCFVRYVRRHVDGFIVSAEIQPQIDQLCTLVDGMPLALELLASWAPILTLDEIIAEVQRGLDIFSTEMVDMPARHRSVYAVCDYSVQRLSERERDMFYQLSVFRGGFDRKAAAAVAHASSLVLARLIDASLLQRDQNGRYQLHELLRQYGEGHLGENSAETYRRHATYYIDWLVSLQAEAIRGNAGVYALIVAEQRNIDALWQWLIEARAFDLLERLVDYFEATLTSTQLHAHTWRYTADALTQLDGERLPPLLEAKLNSVCGNSLFHINTGDSALPFLQRALDRFQALNLAEKISSSMRNMAWALGYEGQYQAGWTLGQHPDAQLRENAAPYDVAYHAFVNHWNASGMGSYDAARAMSAQVVRLAKQHQLPTLQLYAQLNRCLMEAQLMLLVGRDGTNHSHLPFPEHSLSANIANITGRLGETKATITTLGDQRMMWGHWHQIKGILLTVQREYGPAADEFRASIHHFQMIKEMDISTALLATYGYAAIAACEQGAADLARRQLVQAAASVRQIPHQPYGAIILCAAGVYGLAIGRNETANFYLSQVGQLENIEWSIRQIARSYLPSNPFTSRADYRAAMTRFLTDFHT